MDIYRGRFRPRLSASSALASSVFCAADCNLSPEISSPRFSTAQEERRVMPPSGPERDAPVSRKEGNNLWTEFFKSCCFKVPLKVVGCMYTFCLVGGCVIGARLQLLGPTDAVLPAFLSLLFFLLAVCARTLLLTSPSEAVKAVSESPALGLGPFSSPRLLLLLLAGFLHLGAAAFALSPLRATLYEESRSLLHAFLVLFACATVFLHLYRHVAQCRFQLLLCPSKPGPAPILLRPVVRLACVETLAGFLLALPLFLLLLPAFSLFSSFPSSLFASPAALAPDSEEGSAFSVSFALSRPLSFLVSFALALLPRPAFSLDGVCVWGLSLGATSLVLSLLLLLFNIHGELQQQARASDCPSVASFLGCLSVPSLAPLPLVSSSVASAVSRPASLFSSLSAAALSGNPPAWDRAPVSEPAARVLAFAPPDAGRVFDEQEPPKGKRNLPARQACMREKEAFPMVSKGCEETVGPPSRPKTPRFPSCFRLACEVDLSTSPRSCFPFLSLQCLLLRWLYDCAESLQSAIGFDASSSALPPYAPFRPRPSLLLSRLPCDSSLWGVCPVCAPGGLDRGTAGPAAATALGSTGSWGALETGRRVGGAWQLLALLQDPNSSVQREKLPLVPALVEFFAECADDFPLLPPHPQASLMCPCGTCEKSGGAAKWAEARRRAKKTKWGEEGKEIFLFTRREAAVLVAQQMLQAGIFGTATQPNLLFTLYGNLVHGATTHFVRLLRTFQQLCVAASRGASSGSAGAPVSSERRPSPGRAAASCEASAGKTRNASALWRKLEPFVPPILFAFVERRRAADAAAPRAEGRDSAARDDACETRDNPSARSRRSRLSEAEDAREGDDRKPRSFVSRLACLWERARSSTGEGSRACLSFFGPEETGSGAKDLWRKAEMECSVMINFVACAVEGFALWLCVAAAVAERLEEPSQENDADAQVPTGSSHPHVSAVARDAAAGLVLTSLEILHQQQLLRRFAVSVGGRGGLAHFSLSPELRCAMDELDNRVRQAVLLMRDRDALRLQALAVGLGPAASLSPLTQAELRKLLAQ
uniref:Transmembrane protein n=1 Tax=Neospora caninum (strain Liverpool) TaxID=572307 RepID=A0A0F7U9H7_NEOCL|nr:TPA: hypothetical protein BN1204_023560 [Neospora caninum Liverpool]